MGAVRTLVDELRRRGVTVHEWPGWDGRGNEGVKQISPVGGIVHHTGSSYGAAYADLAASQQKWAAGGCLCNFAGNSDGSLTVIASGLAWHAGPGAGPSLGPLAAVRNNMNARTVGLEIVYPGDKPMTDAQYRTAQLWTRTVADLFGGGDVECVRAHAETNGNAPGGDGKWDPGYGRDARGNGLTIDMAAFRRGAASISQEDEVTPQDIEAVANAVVAKLKTEEVWLEWPDGKGGVTGDHVQLWPLLAHLYETLFHGPGFNQSWGKGILPRLQDAQAALDRLVKKAGV